MRVDPADGTRVAAFVLAIVACGCAGAHRAPDVDSIGDRIRERTGAQPGSAVPSHPAVPPGVTLEDGLTQDEAVAVALWNNAEFQVSLTDLGFALVDLVEAGLLRNPVLSLLFPVGPKQLEATLKWPIEVLWERPRRVAAARVAVDAVAERLVQAGLDLAASVKIGYADLALAGDRERLAEEAAKVQQRVHELTQARLKAGDISQMEARAAEIDAARAQEEARRAAQEVQIARVRLRRLLGLAIEGPDFRLAENPAEAECGPETTLLGEAMSSRPDVRAAELSIEAAARRLGWERSRILTLTAVLDANAEGKEGFEMGPGVDVGFPLFDRNQGGRARAGVALQRATFAYAATRQRVAGEVREAFVQYEQARESLALWRDTIVRPAEENVIAAERAYAEGETSFLFVMEATRRLSDARVREREADADAQRARARVERAIGRRCGPEGKELKRGF